MKLRCPAPQPGRRDTSSGRASAITKIGELPSARELRPRMRMTGGDPVLLPGSTVMPGVNAVIEQGYVDPERLAIMGQSYGAYCTLALIAQTQRFKAASVGAAVTNLMSFNGTSDIPSFVPSYFGAQSWEALDSYQKHSPMFNVKGVTTPTMIQQGDADVRVPISQGYEFYNALKQQGVPTRMLVLPRQPHGPTEPKMQLAAMKANLEWFAKYLGMKKETSRN